MAIQTDWKKAFDQIAQTAVTDVLVRKAHRCFVLWKQRTISAKLDHVASEKIALHRESIRAHLNRRSLSFELLTRSWVRLNNIWANVVWAGAWIVFGSLLWVTQTT